MVERRRSGPSRRAACGQACAPGRPLNRFFASARIKCDAVRAPRAPRDRPVACVAPSVDHNLPMRQPRRGPTARTHLLKAWCTFGAGLRLSRLRHAGRGGPHGLFVHARAPQSRGFRIIADTDFFRFWARAGPGRAFTGSNPQFWAGFPGRFAPASGGCRPGEPVDSLALGFKAHAEVMSRGFGWRGRPRPADRGGGRCKRPTVSDGGLSGREK